MKAGIALGLAAAIMFGGIGFGMYKSLEQAQQYGEYRKRCEAAGGVYRRGKYESPACFDPSVFRKVPR